MAMMDFEGMDMWEAMKDVKYKRTLDALRKIVRGAHTNMEAALTVALEMVASASHAEAGTFWFYDRYGDGLIRPKAFYGGSAIGDFYLTPGEGVAGKVIETGQPTIIPDCQKDPRWAGKVDTATGFVTKTMMCVPLTAENAVFGSIQIINRTDGGAFDDKDLAFAMRLAETTSDLFAAQGLLQGYQKHDVTDSAEHISAANIFLASSLQDMEVEMRGMAEFVALGVNEQDEVLEHMRDVWKIFSRFSKSAHLRGGFNL